MTQSQNLMAGKRGLIFGVANDHSIAWGIARVLAAQKADIALTYQDDNFKKRVLPLAESIGAPLTLPCDVADQGSIDAVFEAVERRWGGLDFVVHAIAFSDRAELNGRFLDTTRENFARSLDISCYSFTALARGAAALMPNGGSILTLTYAGSRRVMPNYNVMGVAKAALEASTRYLAADLGPRGIRVNALSAGPMRTLAGAAISGARFVYKWQAENAPLRRGVTLDEIGGAALFLLSDLGCGTTGEILHVDAGYNVVGMIAEN
jgi:enoyl-[acyl-carrier protein] reductase I